MSVQPELVTIFRSADATAKEDASAVCELLAAEGLAAGLFDDTTPGVPSGACEVRVPAAQAARAEELLAVGSAEAETDEPVAADNSSEMDLVTVFRQAAGGTYEIEALAVQSMLESNAVDAVLVGDQVLPNFSMEVRVPREQADEALRLIAEAQAAGPAAADEAEQADETAS